MLAQGQLKGGWRHFSAVGEHFRGEMARRSAGTGYVPGKDEAVHDRSLPQRQWSRCGPRELGAAPVPAAVEVHEIGSGPPARRMRRHRRLQQEHA